MARQSGNGGVEENAKEGNVEGQPAESARRTGIASSTRTSSWDESGTEADSRGAREDHQADGRGPGRGTTTSRTCCTRRKGRLAQPEEDRGPGQGRTRKTPRNVPWGAHGEDPQQRQERTKWTKPLEEPGPQRIGEAGQPPTTHPTIDHGAEGYPSRTLRSGESSDGHYGIGRKRPEDGQVKDHDRHSYERQVGSPRVPE